MKREAQVEIMLLEARTRGVGRGEAWKAFAAICANRARFFTHRQRDTDSAGGIAPSLIQKSVPLAPVVAESFLCGTGKTLAGSVQPPSLTLS